MGLGKLRLGHALDITNIATILEILMDEFVQVPKLEFDGRPNIIESHDARMLADNLKTPLQITEVIIGHLQDKEIFKNIAIDHKSECAKPRLTRLRKKVTQPWFDLGFDV